MSANFLKISFMFKWLKIYRYKSEIFYQFSSVQSLSCDRLFVTPWITARQASLSITISRSSPKLMCIESVMPSSHLILCCPLLLLPSIFPSIRVFSNEWTLRMRWPKYWSFSLSISPSNEHPGLVSFRMDWLDLLELSFLSFHKGLQLPALLLDPSGCFFCGVIAPQGSKVLKGLAPGKLQVNHLLYMMTFLVFFCPSFQGKKLKY